MRAARGDVTAWVGGGVVWGLVMAYARHGPDGIALGALLSLALHRGLATLRKR